MERYFILMIAVTLAGVTVRKKNAPGAIFKNIRQKSGKKIAALAVCENVRDSTHTHTKFKIPAGVLPGKEIYETTSCKKNVQKIIENPHILFNILRTRPFG
jgi:hypothetical protein